MIFGLNIPRSVHGIFFTRKNYCFRKRIPLWKNCSKLRRKASLGQRESKKNPKMRFFLTVLDSRDILLQKGKNTEKDSERNITKKSKDLPPYRNAKFLFILLTAKSTKSKKAGSTLHWVASLLKTT